MYTEYVFNTASCTTFEAASPHDERWRLARLHLKSMEAVSSSFELTPPIFRKQVWSIRDGTVNDVLGNQGVCDGGKEGSLL